MEFTPFPKIARWNRDTIITEKIDGTNAQIYIQEAVEDSDHNLQHCIRWENHIGIWAGSRNRWLHPGGGDNYGFASWVLEHAEELLKLGPGRHFGEWWGNGIQRGYGLDERRFSLFDVVRWQGNPDLPKCCHVVPLLGVYRSMPNNFIVQGWVDELRKSGSRLATWPAEGIVIHHTQSRQSFKVTLDNDDAGKGHEK